MSDDIVARLRQLDADLVEDEGVVPFDCVDEAIDEIERLRAERDEARRWICKLLANPNIAEGLASLCCGTPRDYAEEQGWDCFKEPR